MRAHLDALGWLYVIWGAFGVLTGLSLGILAAGTRETLAQTGQLDGSLHPAVWLLAFASVLLTLAGLCSAAVGRAVLGRRPAGRVGALLLAVPTLLIVPFGTALGVYTFWVLAGDEAKRAFAPADTISL